MKRVIAIMLIATMTLLGGCAADDTDDQSSSVSGLVSQAPAKPIENDVFEGKYFDTDIWQAVPMISQELIDAGYENAEACQAVAYVVLDPTSGKLGYMCTDVGGIYRTLDGGISWHPANIGMTAAGGTGVAIDPNNINRAVLVGADAQYNENNCMFLTSDGGNTWRSTFTPGKDGYIGSIGIHNDYRIQVAFDESSMDEKIGGSSVVYWTRENYTKGKRSPEFNHPAIYKSTDGGASWKELENTSEYAGGYIVVHPKDGRIAVSNENGVWVSNDGGVSFNKQSDLAVNSLVGVRTRPDNLWALTNDGLYLSTDFGKSFNKVTEQMVLGTVEATNLRVSPSNPDYMVMLWIGNGNYNYGTYYTHDGGKSWSKSAQDKSGSWIPVMSWKAVFWFSPVDENFIIANSYRSENGGELFFRSTKGFNGICIGGIFTVNINNDRFIALGSQDANGGFSTDGGKTWNYVFWGDHDWGGHNYGSYCINENIAVTANSNDWGTEGELRYTKDGGKTIVKTGLKINGNRVGYAAYGKENICFMAEYRTDDYCDTWTKMEGCTGVFEHDRKTGRLFGANGFEVVCSDDDGVTWTRIALTGGSKIEDIAYNSDTGILYVCTNGTVMTVDVNSGSRVLTDIQLGIKHAKSICIDPENSNIMYAIECGTQRYQSGVWRTLDGGKTWTALHRTVGDGRDNCPDGGNGSHIEFRPSTREIFVGGRCMGLWKMKAAEPTANN